MLFSTTKFNRSLKSKSGTADLSVKYQESERQKLCFLSRSRAAKSALRAVSNLVDDI